MTSPKCQGEIRVVNVPEPPMIQYNPKYRYIPEKTKSKIPFDFGHSFVRNIYGLFSFIKDDGACPYTFGESTN